MCCLEDCIDSGGEGEAQFPHHYASEVGADRRQVQVDKLVEEVDHGLRGFSVNQWDRGVFEDLGELIDGCGRQGGWEISN